LWPLAHIQREARAMEIILTDPAAVVAARPAVVVASDTAAASAWLASPYPREQQGQKIQP